MFLLSTLWGRGGADYSLNINYTQGADATTDTSGKPVAAVIEKAQFVFTEGLKASESVTIAGVTLTATQDATATAVAAAFQNLASGATPNISGFISSGSVTAGFSSGSIATVGVASGGPPAVTFTYFTTGPVSDIGGKYDLLFDNDTFVWNAGDAVVNSVDVIKDFSAWNGTRGDKLDIKNLLTGYTSGTSTLSQWVTIATAQIAPGGTTTNSTKITIDIDGGGSGTTNQTIWLEGVTISSTDPTFLKNNLILIA